ncbi:MAG: GNAT family N-acetyltransferase [Halobacteriota archaeon]
MSTVDHLQEYEIRPYESADRDDFLDLYEAVWGRRKSRAWFEWRFEAAPYLDEVPMVVAEADGMLAGAEPCLLFRLRAGAESTLAAQPADWMVHPEHRRQGLFTAMTEVFLKRVPEWGPRLCYNFPSEAILPGLRKFDWRVAGRCPTQYRIQNPEAVAREYARREGGNGGMASKLAAASRPVARSYLGVKDFLAHPLDEIAVEKYEQPPVGIFTRLYEQSVPARIHVYRDEAFYHWRFKNPRWETASYVAFRDGEPVAGVVACTEQMAAHTCTMILDVLPFSSDRTLVPAFTALVGAVVDDNDAADVLKVAGTALPSAVLSKFGFRSDGSFPLSMVSKQTILTTRPAQSLGDTGSVGSGVPNGVGTGAMTDSADDAWHFAGRCFGDLENWQLVLAGQDVG